MAVWNYLELASFGGVISLYKYYVFERQAMKDKEAVKGLLFPTKALRNAAAHNGNMLSTLGSKLRKPVGSISRMAVEELGIDRELASLTKRAPIVHDFTALALFHRPRPLLHAHGQERGRERRRRRAAPSPVQAIHGARGLLLQAGRAEERPGHAQRGHGQGG